MIPASAHAHPCSATSDTSAGIRSLAKTLHGAGLGAGMAKEQV